MIAKRNELLKKQAALPMESTPPIPDCSDKAAARTEWRENETNTKRCISDYSDDQLMLQNTISMSTNTTSPKSTHSEEQQEHGNQQFRGTLFKGDWEDSSCQQDCEQSTTLPVSAVGAAGVAI